MSRLETYGRYYGQEHLAIAFTAGTTGDNAKRVTTRGWDQTKPLPSGNYGAGLLTTSGQNHNPVIVLRPSNLIALESDSEADLTRIEQLGLPQTLTVRSSTPYKRHFYFRPPEHLEAIPYVAFRFENGKLTADTGRYFLAPPSIHPSGTIYSFLPGLGPGETDIVELPEHTYRDLCDQARTETNEQRERIADDPEAKIYAGNRRDLIFRYACMLRRWGRPEHAILAECRQFNQERCEPPVDDHLIQVQVTGAMNKQGDQELEPAGQNGDTPIAVIIEPLRAFLQRALPPAEALVGVTRNGTNLLPRYGWVLPWGREGSGKTSVLVDLLYHICSGLNWLHYQVDRPVRVVAVINEGIPGGLQDKLRQKLDLWNGDTNPILDNLAVYASPWGAFTFRNQTIVDHAHDYAHDFEADYIALDPLHTLGTSGAGSPQETEEFKHRLRDFGLWDNLGIITAHHSNKNGMVSGDWARHADTVLRLEKDGQNPATKITLEKARPADPLELGVPMILEWNIDTLGYRRIELPTTEIVSDTELLDRILEYLRDEPAAVDMKTLKSSVQGNPDRVADVARTAIKNGEIVNESTHGGRYALRHHLQAKWREVALDQE